jgi:membrane protease YdiL (CAAX protease family)
MMRRNLVPLEVGAVLAAAIAAPWLPVPVALPLLVVVSLVRWLCGRSFGEHVRREYAAIGAAAGGAALVLALIAGAPLVEAFTGGAVVWSDYPIVRGNANALIAVLVIASATAIATELVLRAWIVERVLELGGAVVPAILVGAFAEAFVTVGPLEARIGAFVVGAALGWMYVASGRNVAVTICARVAFQVGVVVLEAARWID